MNIGDQQKLLVQEAQRRRAAALADYERRQNQTASLIPRNCACCSDQPTVPPNCPACKGRGGFGPAIFITVPEQAADRPTMRTPDTARPVHPKLAEVLDSYGVTSQQWLADE